MSDNELQRRWAGELEALARTGSISRREVLRKASVFGLSVPLVSALLAACGSDDKTSSSSSTSATSTTTGASTSSSTAATTGATTGASTASSAAASTAATTAGSAAPAGVRGGTLSVGALAPSTEVDPVVGYDAASIAVFQLVNEYLIWLNPDFTLRPQLAEKWTPEQDGKQWVVSIRQGVKFSDGTALDADTVKATFDRLLDPASKSSAALSAFDGVLEVGGVSVKDANTVVFDLARPYADFPYLISANTYNSVILPKDYAGSYTTKAVGTGPFTLTSFSATDGAKFARNESYWDAGKPLLDGVEIKFYKDAQSQVLGLQSGEVDTQVTSLLNLLTPIENDKDFTIDKIGGTGVTVFTLRVDTPPFDKKEIRQAIAYALDRDAINETLSDGSAVLGNDHLFAPAYPASPTDITQRAIDLDKVKQLLGGQEISFKLTFEPPTQDYAVIIQEQLKQAGITVDLDQRSSDDFYAGDQTKDTPWLFTPANLVGWAGRAVPTQFIIPMVKSGGTWNGSKYANPALDAAADAYDASTDLTEKKKQAEIIAKALNEDTPIIITTWATAVRPYNSKKWTGITAHPSSFVDFSTVSKVS
ncbi:MAG: extracellular solute-binding protein family 5 [Ilumatobacteraceae bacterium]|nr:extracellular solute-binding protein family 5 [Ilumatobacteraceae bacterium]